MRFLLSICLALLSWPLHAEQLSTQYGDLQVNARLVVPEGQHSAIYLIVHGTWAHNEMDIIRALQDNLSDRGYPSLAPNLSLGLNNRSGFLPCSPTMAPDHGSAALEIKHWIDVLRSAGWQSVIVIGHSRAGAQVALYQQQYPDPLVHGLVLLAPPAWRSPDVAAQYNKTSPTPLEKVLATANKSPLERIGPYRLLRCEAVTAPGQTFLSYYSPQPEKYTPTLVRNVTVPVQVFLGSDDTIVRWRSADRNMASRNTNVQIHDIEGAGHFFRDLYLDDVLDLILASN